MPEKHEESGYTVTVNFKEGIGSVSREEIQLIESKLPELLKLLMEESVSTEE